MKRRVGLLKSVHLYPVKSMQGCEVAEAQVYWYGLNGDRKYACLRDDARSGFPWLTGRDLSDLLAFRPHFLEPGDPHASPVAVTTCPCELR